jgi:hypothetical protein
MAIPSFEQEMALGTTLKMRFQLQDEETLTPQALSTMSKIWLTGKLNVDDTDAEALINLYWPAGGGTTIGCGQRHHRVEDHGSDDQHAAHRGL